MKTTGLLSLLLFAGFTYVNAQNNENNLHRKPLEYVIKKSLIDTLIPKDTINNKLDSNSEIVFSAIGKNIKPTDNSIPIPNLYNKKQKLSNDINPQSKDDSIMPNLKLDGKRNSPMPGTKNLDRSNQTITREINKNNIIIPKKK